MWWSFTLAKVFVGEQASWPSTNDGHLSRLDRHLFPDSFRIDPGTTSDSSIVVLVAHRRPETLIVVFFVARWASYRFECLAQVHVYFQLRESFLRTIHVLVSAKRAFIEFVDVSGIKVVCDVKHILFIWISTCCSKGLTDFSILFKITKLSEIKSKL